MQFLRFTIISLVFFYAEMLPAQLTQVLVDESYSDWQTIPIAHNDPTGDQGNSVIDFKKMWLHNDENYLFLRLETGGIINIQSNNNITLYVDTDNNSSTGKPIMGIGAELEYNLGDREGFVRLGGSTTTINHSNIGLITLPTVTATQFEIAIAREVNFFGQALFPQQEIKIAFENNVSNGDRLPNTSGGVNYSFKTTPTEPLPEFSIDKKEAEHLRILSYNVLFDGFFENFKQASFERIFQAIQPDIIGFQEIYDFSSGATANKVETFLPSAPGEEWYHSKVFPDIIAVSRYPILNTFQIQGSNSNSSGNGAFLIDITEDFGTKLLFIVAHLPCCGNDTERQQETDAIMAFIRNAKNGIGNFTIEKNTPIIIVGDMNFVGFAQQRSTLLTGNIINQNTFGNDFTPDWDGTDFEDAKPYTTHLPMAFTWINNGGSFSPGRLDYCIYSGSILQTQNSFALFTPVLPNSILNQYNLQTGDTFIASDHLPVVVDFTVDLETAVSDLSLSEGWELAASPNPFQKQIHVKYKLPKRATVKVSLLGLDGKEWLSLDKGIQIKGTYEVMMNTESLSAGSYFLKVMTEDGVLIERLVKIY